MTPKNLTRVCSADLIRGAYYTFVDPNYNEGDPVQVLLMDVIDSRYVRLRDLRSNAVIYGTVSNIYAWSE